MLNKFCVKYPFFIVDSVERMERLLSLSENLFYLSVSGSVQDVIKIPKAITGSLDTGVPRFSWTIKK